VTSPMSKKRQNCVGGLSYKRSDGDKNVIHTSNYYYKMII